MEVLRTIGSVMGSVKMLADLIAKNTELAGELATDLEAMNKDFEIIRTLRLEGSQKQQQLTPGMQLLLQELAYDIDDFIQGFWVPGPCASFILLAIRADKRTTLLQRVEGFKGRIKNLKDELPKSYEAKSGKEISKTAGPWSSSVGSPIPYAPEVDLVGIGGPKTEIEELLSPRVEPHLARLSIISIVGCNGSGKTALARALYEDEDVVSKFDYKTWVVASDHSYADIVNKIHQGFVSTSTTGSTTEALQNDKRYLVFVDDVVRETPWKDITNAFRATRDSRIILTTRVPSVARDCSSGSYFYTMKGLDRESSRELFQRKFWGNGEYSAEDGRRLGNEEVDIIVDKCDGLPIALISAAECLRRKGQQPKTIDFKQVNQEVRDRLACSDSTFEEFQRQNGIETTFAEMRRARVEPYENQLSYGEKECLLYVRIFPYGHQINSNSLIRRLIVEGLVPGDPEVKAREYIVGNVRECVRKLMDQRMIEPVPTRNYTNVAKRCRVHSIMLQFTIKKASSRNLVSQIYNNDPLHSATGLVRRLTVQSSPDVGTTGPPEGMGLSVVRSLAIYDSGILNLEECRLVRVLDLEGCLELKRKDLDNICELMFLKFLSLRNTGILELPPNMKKLMFLETLDTRGTRDDRDTVEIKLPVEVLTLPRFAYLFGKFQLTNVHSGDMKEINKFFSEKRSHLHTLGGIAVHEAKGLEIVLCIIQYATKLKKVKVWYLKSPSSTRPVTTSTPAASGIPGPPCAGPLADSSSNAQDEAPATSTLVPVGTAGLPYGWPLADSKSNAHYPDPAVSKIVANGTLEPMACASRQHMFKHKRKRFWFFSKRKPSAGPASNPTSNTHDPAPATSTRAASGTPGLPCAGSLEDSSNTPQNPAPAISTPVDGATPGLPSAGPSADSRNTAQNPAPTISAPVAGGTSGLSSAGPSADPSSNAQDPGPSTSTPAASGTQEPFPCVNRLAETLRKRSIGLESVSVDFNGVPNTFLDFIQNSGTISSIKLRGGLGSLPKNLGEVCNLKKLHLFSTGLRSEQLASLQYLTCLQYLKLAEDGHGLWDSIFHVQVGGFRNLIWLCFEASNSLHPPLKFDEGAKIPLTSLLLFCKESHPRVEGMSHLEKLNEVILHNSATDDEVTAWKEEAKKHINRPCVEKQQV